MQAPTSRYIDLLNDVAFKKIFGSDPNKDLMIAFLNDVFRGRKQILDLVYSKTEHHGDIKTEGSVSFDLLCTGINNEKFIIEVQREKHENFKERSIFYTSRLISEQAPKGKRKDWNYNLTEVYLIAILENTNFTLDTNHKYLYDICLCNREDGEIFYDKLGYTYIQLSNFTKQAEELETDLDKWVYILKNISQMNKIPAFLRKPIFEKLFNIAEYSNLTKEEKMSYDMSLKQKWDNYSVQQTARNEGVKEGKEIEKHDVALKMKQKGMPINDIMEITGLTKKQIEELQ